MNWDEIRVMLREAHEEPLEEAHLAAVRARVLGRVQRKRRVWWPVWAGAVAAGTLAVMLFVARTQQPAIPRAAGRVAVVQAPTTGPLPDGRGSIPSHERKRVVRRKLTPTPPAPPAEPLLVKLITDDPNVVIYWIADTKGD